MLAQKRKSGDLVRIFPYPWKRFLVDNDMVIPDKIRVVNPMYASRFDEDGNVTPFGGTHDDDKSYLYFRLPGQPRFALF